MGKNGDPQTGWMKVEQRGCSFQVDKFQQLSTIQGLTCIVSDVDVPKAVSAFRILSRVCRVSYRIFRKGGKSSDAPTYQETPML